MINKSTTAAKVVSDFVETSLKNYVQGYNDAIDLLKATAPTFEELLEQYNKKQLARLEQTNKGENNERST